MIAIILLPIYLLINYFILKEILKLNKKKYRIFIIIIYSLLVFSPLIGILNIKYISVLFKNISNYFIIIFVYLTLILLIKKTFKINKIKLQNKIILLLIPFLFILFGLICQNNMIVTKYDINSKKNSELNNLKIAVVSDLHLGVNNGYKLVKKIKDKINEENVDILLLVGDIFDNSDKYIDNTNKVIEEFNKINTTYGKYAVYGNHDVEETTLVGFTFDSDAKISESMKEILNKSNIDVLKDETVLIDNKFYLIGRLDSYKVNDEKDKRENISNLINDFDLKKPVILMEHEPDDYQNISNYDIDLVVSGHTHNGQVFPGNILMKFIWDNPYGYKKINNLNTIVSSGVGTFGPNIRIGTKSEIVIINMTFNN